jgi:hypothetical protein
VRPGAAWSDGGHGAAGEEQRAGVVIGFCVVFVVVLSTAGAAELALPLLIGSPSLPRRSARLSTRTIRSPRGSLVSRLSVPWVLIVAGNFPLLAGLVLMVTAPFIPARMICPDCRYRWRRES